MLREWMGEKLVKLGLRVLGANTEPQRFEPPPVPLEEEREEVGDLILPATISDEARAMVVEPGDPGIRRWRPREPEPEAPLEGSIQDRVAKARAEAGE